MPSTSPMITAVFQIDGSVTKRNRAQRPAPSTSAAS